MGYFIATAAILPFTYLIYLIVQSFFRSRSNARKAQELGCGVPPERPTRYPGGLDVLYDMAQADKHHRVPNHLEDVHKKLGELNTYTQKIFWKRSVVTTEPKNIQAILATKFRDFEIGQARRGNFFPLLGNGIFTADGKMWEHSRALLRPQFSRDQVGDLELEEKHVQDMFKHLITGRSGWTSNVNLQPIFFRLTLDSATEFLFGQSVHSQLFALPNTTTGNQQNIIGIDLAKVSTAFDSATHSLGIRARYGDQYWIHSPKSFHDNCKLVHEFVDYYVNLALQTDHSEKANTGQKQEKYIFLKELVRSTRDPIELRSQLLNILIAGRDTTAGLLGWTFWELARHPEIFQKLRSEILSAFGPYPSNDTISFTTLKSCTYLQYVMNETLRLFPSVPFNTRRAVVDTTLPLGGGPFGLQPVFIPANTQVDYSVHVMHRRTDLWGGDANCFNPSRWQGRKSGWEYLPFNGGPRICLGQQFALTEAGYVIVRLLQRFDAIENLDDVFESDPQHQYSVTTAPWKVPVRLHEANS